jgi:hypothetical protein
MGLTHIARGSIKSVQAYGLNLLGKINGHLNKGKVFYTKTCILIIYCTVPSKFPFLRMSMFTKMHWHFPEHCRIPNSTENQIGQACIFDLVTAFITHVCSISQRYITFTAKATSFKHQRNNEKYNCSSNQQRHFCNWSSYKLLKYVVHFCNNWVVTDFKKDNHERSDSIPTFFM